MNRYEPKMRELNATPLGKYKRVSETEIQEAERILGARLPEDYREFVRDFSAFNINAVFPVQAETLRRDNLEVLKGIAVDEDKAPYDIVRGYIHRNFDVMSDDCISLGWNSGSGGTVYAFKGLDAGKVFALDYSFQLCFVANSFDSFMQLLKNESDEPEAAEDAAPFWATFSTE